MTTEESRLILLSFLSKESENRTQGASLRCETLIETDERSRHFGLRVAARQQQANAVHPHLAVPFISVCTRCISAVPAFSTAWVAGAFQTAVPALTSCTAVFPSGNVTLILPSVT